MKMVRALLVGTAAGFLALSSAHASDLKSKMITASNFGIEIPYFGPENFLAAPIPFVGAMGASDFWDRRQVASIDKTHAFYLRGISYSVHLSDGGWS